MIRNDRLRIHVINVGHGDSILVEFPDVRSDGVYRPRFGLVDAGGEDADVRSKTLDYVGNFLEYRLEGTPSTESNDPDADDYIFEFICLTHPHADHLHGMMDVIEGLGGDDVPEKMRPRQFWDCGFRYNTTGYLEILEYLSRRPDIQFMRVASGTEFHFGDVEILVLAPSVDMRNRYDTYGVSVNNASIVLRISYGNGVAILTGDAHFDTWGKVCEEFPRTRHIIYPEDSNGGADMRSPVRDDIAFLNQENQLNCQLLKVSHHGSKRGTSYEYVEKLSPSHFAISCDRPETYRGNWRHKFPHALNRLILAEEAGEFEADSTDIPSVENLDERVGTTAAMGTLVYRVGRGRTVRRWPLGDSKNVSPSVADFINELGAS